MRIRPLFFLLALSSILAVGCDISAPKEVGETCPPNGENGVLAYIKSSAECIPFHCDLGDYSVNFEYSYCPEEYSYCRKSDTVVDGLTRYYCDEVKVECPAGYLNCTACEDCQEACVSPSDVKHCGANSCKAENYGGTNCQAKSEIAVCQQSLGSSGGYFCACPSGYDFCGEECVYFMSDQNHCGKCNNKCEDTERCLDGDCIPTGCSATQCAKRVDSEIVCSNSIDACGPKCDNCKNLHDSAECSDALGKCVITACNEGEHPIYNDTHIEKCEKNSAEACAPHNNKSTDEISNCNLLKTEGVSGVECTTEGSCRITGCDLGYYSSSDGMSCIKNTLTACGVDAEGAAINCNTQFANAAETDCVDNQCVLKKCSTNFHIGPDSKSCVINNEESCAEQDSLLAVNCKQMFEHVNTAVCTKGQCQIYICENGYHISSDNLSCVPNSPYECAAPNSSNVTDCTKVITTGIPKCDNGTCTKSNCQDNYHFNQSNECVPNTPKECGSNDSSVTVNCETAFSNAAAAKCDNGTCKITSCNADYHISTDGTACVPNSDYECGSPSSSVVKNCNALPNVESGTCQNGSCVVSNCHTNFHINSSYTGCVLNTNIMCGQTYSASTVNCTSQNSKVCSYGSCVCPGDTVSNYNDTACVPKACMGIPGVMSGSVLNKNRGATSGYEYACNASSCAPGFTYFKDSTGVGACRPQNTSMCSSYGYVRSCSGYGCVALGPQCLAGYNSHDKCLTGYREYAMACIEDKYCCGTRDPNHKSSSDWLCTNCIALGYSSCNISTGSCQ